jgi:hypothetical protein
MWNDILLFEIGTQMLSSSTVIRRSNNKNPGESGCI